jgi:penicillin-binding protein 1C
MKRLMSFFSIWKRDEATGKKSIKRSWMIGIVILVCSLFFYYIALPDRLFTDPFSTVLLDRNKELLSASIAADGQWRFPEEAEVSDKFAEAIILFEDKRFRSHFGVDPRSFARAIKQNIEASEVVSGGSTITMQVIRLSRNGKSRSFYEKVIEMILATRLEWRYSKAEILALYTAHAPFGGNVVGLEAACWRYFGRDPSQLSWAEAALLAVLPNAPSLMHPGKNRDLLLVKRNRLLTKLRDTGKIDAFTCSLAMEETIPDEPKPLPRLARHLLDQVVKQGNGGKKIITTLQLDLQVRVEQILNDHHLQLQGNHVFNGAALVVEVNTGNVLAYIGNTSVENEAFSGNVDVIQAPRSTGSILKPFLFAALIEEGKTLPTSLWPDIPLQINGFTPKNFSKEFDGAVPADKALIRSLNVPAVNMLRTYRYEKFYSLLEQMGMTTLRNEPDHYGLSLILGGAEGTLWDITGMYASSARILNRYFQRHGNNRYRPSDIHPLNFYYAPSDSAHKDDEAEADSWLSAAAIYQTFDVLKEVYRPGEESGWRYFNSSKKIAWKTGTSFGHRDAWAVGVTPDYVTGVWIGNADGEGRPGLTGTDAAAPVMLDIFSQLPGQTWFQEPFNELEQIIVCKKSGYRCTPLCDELDTIWATQKGLTSSSCPFHKKIHLTSNKKFRVHGDCDAIDRMVATTWFVLPPVQEYYYRSKNIYYKSLPPFRKDCQPMQGIGAMDLVYPRPNSKIFIPRELDGSPGQTVFELAHRDASATVFWHLDGSFIGSTRKTHSVPLNPTEGPHTLTIVDASGEFLERRFEVLSKR